MTKLFIDTNVIMDILAKREPFFNDAAKLVALAENKEIILAAASLSFVNVFYILSKSISNRQLIEALIKFRIVCEVTSVDEMTIDKSLHSGFSDFEDAVQYHSALAHQSDIFITRNKKDFKKIEIPLMTPTEFLTSIKRR